MVSIRRKILDKGNIVQEQLLNVLQKHEDALAADTISDATIGGKVEALETAVGGENSGLVKDVTGLKATVGDANTDNTLVKDVATLKTSKANSNHSHTLSSISDLETVEAVVTYTDTTTATLLLVKQTAQNNG